MADARPGISETAVRIAEWLECDVYLEHDQSLLIKEGGKGVCAALVDYWAATILRSGSETPHILFHSELKEAGSNHMGYYTLSSATMMIASEVDLSH